MDNSTEIVLAFYGNELDTNARSQSIESYWAWASAFSSRFSLEFTDFSCRTEKSGRFKINQCYSIASNGAALETTIRDSDLLHLNLYSLRDKSTSPAFDSDLSISIGNENESLARCDLSFSATFIDELGFDGLMSAAGDVIEIASNYFEVVYGFIVAMPRAFFPSGYVVGLGGEGPEELVYDANIWRKRVRHQANRSLRNVFGMNFLSADHSEVLINDQPLLDWIAAKPCTRGGISQFGYGLQLWKIDEAAFPALLNWNNTALISIRNEMMKGGAFAWADFLT